MDYNGWTNWETWNVALWIQNDEGLYRSAYGMVRNRGHLFGAYKEFVRGMGLENEETPDGAAYISDKLDYQELDEMMLELVSWG